MKSHFPHFITLLAISIILSACNTTKYVKDQEYLLDKNTIKIDGKTTSDFEITSYLIQRPNNTVLGIPLGLHIYNIGNLDYDSIHQLKMETFVNRNNFWDRTLSKKQTLKLLNKKKSINNWFLNKGEAPIILNSRKTSQTEQNLRTHFFNNGYFNSTVKTTVINDVKKANVIYNITKNEPFYIGPIHYKISSPSVAKTLGTHLDRLPLQTGQQYHLENFKNTVSKITRTLRNNGYYHFSEGLVSFKEIDTLAPDHITPIDIHIENRRIKKGNEIIELPTKIQTLQKISVYTDYSYQTRNTPNDVKKTYNLLDFYAHSKLKYRTKTLANSIFIAPNQIYNDESVELTRNHLRSLNNFKSIKITHKELANNKLATTIVLTPQKKYGVGLNTEIIHSNIKQLGLSGGFSFINRNLFRGAEIFQLSLQGSIFDTATKVSGEDSASFNAYEVGVDASLEFPRFIFPFFSNIVPRTMTPKTKVTIGTSFQKNIGLDKQKVSGVINYSWKSSSKNTHNIELLNLQFINNLNPESYFDIYSSEFRKISEIKPLIDANFNLTTSNALNFINSVPSSFASSNPTEYTSLKNIAKREEIITSNNIIPATSYSFEHNSRRGLSDTSYNFFKTKISSSGNVNGLFFKEEDHQKTFQGIAISEFIKIDIDYRKFWSKSINNSLAFRAFVGVAIPTGKNKDIPFITSYFAGGSNDIRAWKTYELGPGSSNTGLEFNIGNLKLLSSLEYRFKIINSIHGAIFADAGNIWNLPSSTTASDEEIFDGLKSLENIALGTGFGVRYDFNFLVLRLDLAFKTFEPYLTENKWLSSYRLNESVLNIGINYPF
ncbi:translocation and assembly module lipoprotein TamL [Wenyingzhuangia aestuarii]|uniref:translocation and assembly module lipoprotein TamL n=1 Tax=Wenyingzhuangia aestuarii TaxID=1647582 RepID=UPI001439563D|nr:BamA/TamA family outer membrane protein [Wenyingzhuangia aestuarii]NJB81629.1 outer membrane protein assembly factor BamA [Wenyingzhuangia aestuarii]